MAKLSAFRALRPRPADAAAIAAVPYDVVTTEEARQQAVGNPLSFLRVSRAELEFPPGTNPFSDDIYDRAVHNFENLKRQSLVLENEPSLYFYCLRTGEHQQTGLAGCFSLDDYDRDVIKKHERTRRDKEDDRTRHMVALGAQTGPVFLAYRQAPDVDDIAAHVASGEPLFDFEAADGVRHTVWRVTGGLRDALVSAVSNVQALYIADGHHRAASAARARHDIGNRGITRSSLGDEADYTTLLGVAFPANQVQILPYNRVVRDLGRLDPDSFLSAVRDRFEMRDGSGTPSMRGEIAMYFNGHWRLLRPRNHSNHGDTIASLDVSILQHDLLQPVLGIGDIRTDKRIDFVGGRRGTTELERLVHNGEAAVAFSLYPVSVTDLMAASDAGTIMPPKSTWFEPKLRDGLLIHLI